jgi:hypothetical protein
MILYSEENVGVTALLNYYVGATPGKKRKLSNEGKKRNKRNTSPGACRENLWVNGKMAARGWFLTRKKIR